LGSIGTYGFINAKARAMRSFLLSPGEYHRLAHTASAGDFFDTLSQTSYGTLAESLKRESAVRGEKILRDAEMERARKLEKSSRGKVKELIRFFVQERELEHVKLLLRYWHAGERESMKKAAEAMDLAGFTSEELPGPDEMAKLLSGTPFYGAVLRSMPDYEKNRTLFPIELAIDRDYFQRFWEFSEGLAGDDRALVQRIMGIEIDLRNLDWIRRSRIYYGLPESDVSRFLLPHGQYVTPDTAADMLTEEGEEKVLNRIGRGEEAERIPMDEGALQLDMGAFLSRILKREAQAAFARNPFTAGSVMGYLFLSRIETQNMITLLQARQYGLSGDRIMNLLIV
jgi:V/A-type H+-transporting ATPase subunit C